MRMRMVEQKERWREQGGRDDGRDFRLPFRLIPLVLCRVDERHSPLPSSLLSFQLLQQDLVSSR